MSGTGKTWQVKGMIKWLVYGCEVWEVLDDNFDQSDECCFSDWGWLKNQLPERSALWHIFSTEGIKWNYSKLFEPHTSSISTFCKISPLLNHFPITTAGIWPIHTVPSSLGLVSGSSSSCRKISSPSIKKLPPSAGSGASKRQVR